MKGMVISMKLIDSIIGSYSDRQIRKILPVVKKSRSSQTNTVV